MTSDVEAGPLRKDATVWTIFIVAILARILAATDSPLINADAYYYLQTSALFAEGKWGDAMRLWGLHPLYPLLVGILELIWIPSRIAGASIGILAGAAAVFPLYGITRNGWGVVPARFTALIFAVHPIFNDMQCRVMTEGLYHFLAVGAGYALWRGLRGNSWKWGGVAGVFAGAAYLTRAEGIILVFLVLGAGGIFWLVPRFRSGWRVLLAAVAAVFFVAAPFLIWLRVDYGRWVASPRALARMVQPGDDLETYPLPPRAAKFRESFGAPIGAALYVGTRAERVYFPALLGLVVAGVVFFRRGMGGGSTGLFVGLICLGHYSAILLHHVLSSNHVSMRYVAYGALMALPWAGWGFARITEWLLARKRGLVLAGAFVVLIVGGLLVKSVKPADAREFRLAEAATWLRDNGGQGKRLMASRDSVAWHADAEHVRVVGRKQMLDAMDDGEVDFIVFERLDIDRMEPALREALLERPGVRLLKTFGPEGADVAVYRVEPAS